MQEFRDACELYQRPRVSDADCCSAGPRCNNVLRRCGDPMEGYEDVSSARLNRHLLHVNIRADTIRNTFCIDIGYILQYPLKQWNTVCIN